MSRLGILAAMALVAQGGAGARAQSATAATRPLEIDLLIGQLDSADFATRQAATDRIAGLGDAARPALLLAREAGSLERRVRIDQILKGLAARAASRPDRKTATLVSIQAADRPLSEVCAALSRASGYAVRVPGGTDPNVTAALRDAPFFEAVDAIAHQASRKADWDAKERAFLLMPASDKPPPTVYAGPLRVSLTMLSVSRQLRFGATPLSSASLQIRIDAEEKARALGILVPLKAKVLLDDQKRDIRFESRSQASQSYLQRVDQRRQLQAYLPMAAPAPDAKAIEQLEVTLPVLVAAETWEARFTSPEEGQEVVDGPFRARIEQWRAGASQLDVSISIARPATQTAGAPNGSVQDDVVTFLGLDGRAIQPIAMATNGLSGTPGIVMTYGLPAGTHVAAAETSSVKRAELLEFPVVFQNVPLP